MLYETLILGGTNGLGYEIAKEVGKRNPDAGVEVVGRSRPLNKEAEIPGHSLFTEVDLTDPESLNCLILDRFTRYKRFFWVAGRMLKGNLDRQPVSEVLDTIDVNFRNSMAIAHLIWRKMQQRGGGESFTVVSSTSGLKPREDEAIYAATKAAQVQFARSLGLESARIAVERGSEPIKVSLFMPGGMKTRLWDEYPHVNLDGFLDPSKVAEAIVSDVYNQNGAYFEREIPRGSL